MLTSVLIGWGLNLEFNKDLDKKEKKEEWFPMKDSVIDLDPLKDNPERYPDRNGIVDTPSTRVTWLADQYIAFSINLDEITYGDFMPTQENEILYTFLLYAVVACHTPWVDDFGAKF